MKELKLLVQRAGLRFVQASIGTLVGAELIGLEVSVLQIAGMAGVVAALQVVMRYSEAKLAALPRFKAVISER